MPAVRKRPATTKRPPTNKKKKPKPPDRLPIGIISFNNQNQKNRNENRPADPGDAWSDFVAVLKRFMADDRRHVLIVNEMATTFADVQTHIKLRYTTPDVWISEFGRTNGRFIASTIVIWKRWIEPDVRVCLKPTGSKDDYGRSIEAEIRIRHLPTGTERVVDLTAVHLPRSNNGSDKADAIGLLVPATKRRPHLLIGDINTRLNDVRRYLPAYLTAYPLSEAEVVVSFVRYRFGFDHPSTLVILEYAGVEIVKPTCGGSTIDFAIVNKPMRSGPAFGDLRWSVADDGYNSVHTSDHRVIAFDFCMFL